jgi:hypothetical protein
MLTATLAIASEQLSAKAIALISSARRSAFRLNSNAVYGWFI